MSIGELLTTLRNAKISISLDGESLVVKGKKASLTTEIRNDLIKNREDLIAILKSDQLSAPGGETEKSIPPNVIRADSAEITPEMLPLIDLTQEEIDSIIERVPGGIANIQDIYALSPLQDGILFHHLLSSDGDSYLMSSLATFPDRALLQRFLSAVQEVVDRHDILRTAFIWEGLSKPVQVVLRRARLSVREVELDAEQGPIAEQLARRFDPRRHRMDLTQAPLLRCTIARDVRTGQWVALLLRHHLTEDALSVQILRSEIEAFLRGQGDSLAPSPAFRNLVAQMRLGVSQEEQERFFREMLGDVSEPTLPFGLSNVHQEGGEIMEGRRMMPQRLNDRLRKQARRVGVSLASLCHLAWGQVLARSSGCERVVFGTVLFGRMGGSEGADQAVGLFINTLPLRLDMDSRATATAVRETHARLAELLMHEHSSLALAQRCSGVETSSPLFSAILNYRHNVVSAVVTDDVRKSHPLAEIDWKIGKRYSNYPLALSIEDFGQGLELTALVVQPLSAERVCGYMQQALESLVVALETAPDLPVRELEILPAEERVLQLETWNATAVPYREEACIHELFEEQVRRAPEAVAVVYEDESLSYGELNERANRLAHYLIDTGVKPDDRVAICVERSLAMVVGLLAILKAGGAYVPLDPVYPTERLRYMLEDSAPVALLTQNELEGLVRGSGVRRVINLTEEEAWRDQPASNPDRSGVGVTAKHLAYVIYTSGSTGMPKGVMVEHGGVCNLAVTQMRAFAVASDSQVLQYASFSFDACVSEIFVTLCHGASLHVVGGGGRLVGEELVERLNRNRISHVTLPPSIVATLGEPSKLDSLRTLIVAGEALSEALARQGAQGRRLINAYGPTEATVCASLHECQPENPGNPPIGRPIANARIYILDEQRKPVPLGAVGEIYIGGAGVARGYLNRPELTGERFVPDGYSGVEGGRMYKTGDLARYQRDGNIEFLGRNDFQVKIRGFRIELGEIEARLGEHAGVGEVAVVVREDEPGEKRLVAYYTRQGGEEGEGEVSAQGLREHVGVKLPEYMVPAAFVRVEGLPLTANGKLDRKALPAPEGEAYAQRGYEEPQGETEETLARLWQELLGVERVGRHDHFFELGGHSLLVVQLMERLRRLNLHMEVRALFATPVLYQLAAALSQHHEVPIPPNVIRADSAEITPEMLPLIDLTQEEIDSIIERVPGGMANIQDIYALSPLQDGILFHHLVASEGDPYLMSGMATFPDRALLQRFLSAVQEVVDRHDILRTAFIWEGLSKPVQVVLRRARLSVREVELDAEQGPIAEQLARRFDPRRHRMDLRQAPLLDYAIAYDRNQDRWVVMHRLHHLIGDHFTLDALRGEVRVFLVGEGQSLVPSPAFRNLVAQMRLGVSQEEQERFFREMLGDVSEPTLPFGLSNVHQEGGEIMEGRRMMPQRLNDRLRKQARRVGVSLASLCHLAWGQVLARSSGCERVVFGTVLFGRMEGSEGADQAVGLFINTLPLRLDMDSRATATAVRETHARLAELLMHEHSSLALAQRCSGVETSIPLFSAILNYRHNVVSAVVADDVRNGDPLAGVESLGSQERNNYPLTLSVEDFGQGLGLTALVAHPLSAERVCGYMQQALESLVVALETAPDLPVRELEILPAEERVLQLETWNATAVPYREEACIHELFEEQVRKAPEAVAVVYEDESLSYGELNERANRLAHYLIDMGIKPDDRVAICVERSLAMVVGVLAILKAGGAYVPLDPVYPVERLRYMLEDSQPVALLTQAHLGERFSGLSTTLPVVDLSSAVKPWNDQPSSNPDGNHIGLGPENLAYVIYTSGSTGTPKGVMIEHKALVNYSLWAVKTYAPSQGAVVSSSVSFDATVTSLYGPLLCRGTTCLIPEGEEVDGLHMKVQGASNCGLLKITPTLLDALGQRILSEPGRSSVTVFVIGGENLRAASVQSWRQIQPDVRIVNEYGPTETTVGCTAYDVPKQDNFSGSVPIGRPIANARIYILDEQRKPVPLGAVGEIYIGGAGVARGYLNRPELTGERFVPDGYSGVEGGRMYKTGDLGRYQRDGNIEFLGRNDFQVKIRGFRIELGEIEARLGEHAGVGEVAVVVREDEPGEKRLVAYYTRQGGEEGAGEVSAQGLREHVGVKLPEYMVPAAFVRVEGLPLTANGKLDRKALPAPEGEAYAQRGYEEPQGETEETLARLWQELLGVERVGRHDHFFELGGHSLLAMQLIVRMQQVLGTGLSILTLFAQPTLAQLAQAVTEARGGGTLEELPPITAVSRLLPLSFAQQRLWFLAQLEDIDATYHIPGALRLRGALDRVALRRSLDALFTRHEALRSVFVAVDGQPHVKLLSEQQGFALIEHDLRGDAEAAERLRQLAIEEAQVPFDLAEGPMIRGRLIQLDEQEHILLLTQHHIVSDGWSLGIFTRELGALYSAFSRQQPDPLPPLPIQYPDYAAWQQQWLSGEGLEKQVVYWRETLAGAPVLLELPTDRPRPPEPSFAGAYVAIQIERELTGRLKQLSGRQGTTLFMTLLAAWGAVLSRLSGQDDVVIGIPTANRRRQETEGLIGFFVNTLALRVDLRNEPGVAELLARVRSTALAGQDHQDLPFEQVVEIVQPPRRLNHTPLFQVMFAWQNHELDMPDMAGLRVEPAETANTGAKFDLELNLGEQGGGITGALNYATALFDEATIKRQIGYLLAMLKAMVTDSEQAVGGIDLLSAEERVLQLETWNATAVPYREEACIHELFEEQVRKAPEAVAVVYEDESLSYGELNERANRLAHYLIDMGIKPDDRVAICVERSLAMVVGVLAILKAGGAYVPLDPVYPVERLRYMLEDSQPVALLTQAHLGERFSGLSTTLPVVDLSSAVEQWNDQPASNPDGSGVGVTAKHLAYVIYTSGSTGMPKGVMVEHAQVTRLFETTYDNYRFDNQDVWCMFHSLAFDFSVWEIWGALRYGGRLVIVPRESVRSVGDFCRLVCNEGVTILNQTPSAFKSFMGVHAESGLQHRLRYVIFGGEALEPSMLKSWYRRHSDRQPQLINMYGITETTVHVTYRPLYVGDGMQSGSPIGKRLADLRMYLLDKKQEPVPLGAVGEIYIGGAGVARGYLNRPELTGERFVPDGYSGVEGGRMYKTGDLGRYQRDGNIEFLGRNDFQVKIRGFRIELGEIEARLAEHAGVGEVAVVVREDEPGEKRLVAYYTRQGGEEGAGEVSAQGLREHVGVKLPEYMVPAAFVRVEGLPLTANGKLDRKALPAPEGEAYAQRGYEEPQGETEETLARLWQELLGVERVGRHDHFFELGGHSLLVVQLMERLRRLNLHMEVRALFATPVLYQLAAALSQHHEVPIPPNVIRADSAEITPEMLPLIDLTQEEIDSIIERVPGGMANIQDIYALSPLQDGILFHHLVASEGDPYLMSGMATFPDRALLQRFLSAVQEVVDRHDILRTAFIWEGLSKPVQVVLRRARLSVREVELDAEQGPIAEQLAQRFDPRRHRMDLRQAPLLDYAIAYDRNQDRWVVMHRLHHLIGDHFTLDALRGEVRVFLVGEGQSLVPSPAFRNLVAQMRLGVSQEEQERFFREMLGDVSEPTLPFGLSNVHQEGGEIMEGRRMMPQRLNDRLRKQARRVGVSLASLCHLAWGQVLARSSGCERVVFGTVLFGRMEGSEGADQAVGLFINTLPLRLDMDSRATATAVRETHARLAELLMHEHSSLALAQRCSGVETSSPLFSAILNYRHNVVSAVVADDVRNGDPLAGVESLGSWVRNNYPVTLSVEDFGQGLGLTALVAHPLSAERVCGYMQQALESLVVALETAPDLPVRELEILPAEERVLQLETWNATAVPYREEACIHELFEEQVRKAPEAVAVVYEDESLSYGELNERANRLAHYLIDMGIKPDDRVAICVERSLAMVVGLLAILKAGGAYVPLDPEYPSERLRQILADAAPAIVLSDAVGYEALGAGALEGLRVIDVEGLGQAPEHRCAWAEQPSTNTDARQLGLTSRHLAYVIYTSGSTGMPKGVMIEHRSVINFHRAMMRSISRLRSSSLRFGWNASFSFDMSIKGFSQLMSGHCLVLIPQQVRASGSALLGFLKRASIDAFDTTPSQLKVMIADGFLQEKSRKRRTVLVGGEPIDPSMWLHLRGCRSIKFHNMYGPTECTVDATIGEVQEADEVSHGGRPIANTRIYILDEQRKPVPLGAVGEIYIGGAGVARGYLNRPELTGERFVPDGYSGVEGGRMYKTGDLARYQRDGNIEFLGRNDFQVKIRGFRIELGEIEARLAEHAGVGEVAVVVREDEPGEKRLVAYYTRQGGEEGAGEVSAQGLREHVGVKLPEYMVPAAFVRVEGLPLTANGKLDRKALPAPEGEAYAQRGYEEPQGETEETLARLWQELLGVERVGRHDHFFELGGHSLLAVQLMVRVQQTFGITLAVRELFICPTLLELSNLVMAGHSKVGHENLVPIRPSGTEIPLFLVHPGGGGIDYIRNLAPYINANIPIYGLEATGLVSGKEPLRTVKEMADLYLYWVYQVQPRGPYRIAGWSAGGIISYEIAKQLIQKGEQVDLLGLIDTWCHRDPAIRRSNHFDDKSELLQFLSRRIDSTELVQLKELAKRCTFSQLVDYIYKIGAVPKEFGSLPILNHATIRGALNTRHAINKALDDYELSKLSAPTWIFAAEENDILTSEGWSYFLTGDIHICPVHGNHLTMMETRENLISLGTAISDAIRATSKQGRSMAG